MSADVKSRPGVAVFGSSEPAEGSALYETGRAVGRLLARHRFGVVTGGYGGVMEAASRGAREEGGEAIGITARVITAWRQGPNPWLTEHREEEGLFERTRELIDRSAAYIILPGKAGTLAELTFLWALHRARILGDRPIVLLGQPWREYLAQVVSLDLLDREQLVSTFLAEAPEDAVSMIVSRIG